MFRYDREWLESLKPGDKLVFGDESLDVATVVQTENGYAKQGQVSRYVKFPHHKRLSRIFYRSPTEPLYYSYNHTHKIVEHDLLYVLRAEEIPDRD